MKVEYVMTREVLTVSAEASLSDAARHMRGLNVGTLPVCEAGQVMGIVTDRDITIRATAEARHPMATTVGDVMTREVVACHPDDDVKVAALLMLRHQVRRLPVLDADLRIVGIVSLSDLALQIGDPTLVGRVLERVSADPVSCA